MSVLGTKEYWDDMYEKDLENFNDFGDHGDIWFGKNCQNRIVEWLKKRDYLVPKKARILDIGCGNGALAIALRKSGFENVSGVDYAESAISLAYKLAQEESVGNIQFMVADILAEASQTDQFRRRFDVLVDKGTYDAIGLSQNAVDARRLYKANVANYLDPSGACRLFIIASCNSTSEELLHDFSPEFEFVDEISNPSSISFAGQQGTTVTTIVFRLRTE